MSDARILHKRAGGSMKVNSLTNFEYRVWTQYILSANDLSVMPATVSILQADNVFLRREKHRLVQAAFDQLVTVGLMMAFLHQGERFVWQPDWQDWQQIKHPRRTVHPTPETAVIVEYGTPLTVALFEKYFSDIGDVISETFLKSSGKVSEPRVRGHARNTNPNPNSDLPEESARETSAAMFHRFWLAYPRKVKKSTAEAEFRKLKPSSGLTDTLIRALNWQTKQPEWVKDGGQYVPHPSAWLHQRRWEDEPFHPIASDTERRSHVPDADATTAMLREVFTK